MNQNSNENQNPNVVSPTGGTPPQPVAPNVGTGNETVSNAPTNTVQPTVQPQPPVAESLSGTPQQTPYVTGTNNVNPVLKETSRVSFSTAQPEETPVDTAASPMDAKKEPKKTRSVIPLIFFFIFLFAFIFFLPDINDYFKEKEGKKKIEEFDQQLREEEEKQKQEEEEAKKEEDKQQEEEKNYKTLTCVSPPTSDVITTINTTHELTYSGDKIKIVKVTANISYLAADDNYLKRKTICENKTIATAEIPGYEFSCAVSELSIEESNKFELKDFKAQTITNSDGSEERITTEYQYDSSLSTTKQTLESQGYTCS